MDEMNDMYDVLVMANVKAIGETNQLRAEIARLRAALQDAVDWISLDGEHTEGAIFREAAKQAVLKRARAALLAVMAE